MNPILDKIADLYNDPVLGVWSFLSLPASGLLFLISYPDPICSFYLFLCLLTLIWIVIAPTIFKDTTHESIDWNEQVDFKKVLTFTVIGVAALFVVGFFLSTVLLGQLAPAIWVPNELLPLSVTTTGFSALIFNLFSTTFAVVPGEESLKASFSVLFLAYKDSWWANKLPFALQPAIMAGVAFWAAEHVVKGQYPLAFAVTVFVSGIIMMFLAAKTGTYLTSWLIHLGYNSLILIAAALIHLGYNFTVIT